MLFSGVGLIMAVVPALAHHSFSAEYDATKQITLKGKFTKMEWVNPHSWVHLDVASDGKVVSWGCETPPPNNLYRQGWRKDGQPILDGNGSGFHSVTHGGWPAGPAGNLAGHERGGL